jgi:hypothetical protein
MREAKERAKIMRDTYGELNKARLELTKNRGMVSNAELEDRQQGLLIRAGYELKGASATPKVEDGEAEEEEEEEGQKDLEEQAATPRKPCRPGPSGSEILGPLPGIESLTPRQRLSMSGVGSTSVRSRDTLGYARVHLGTPGPAPPHRGSASGVPGQGVGGGGGGSRPLEQPADPAKCVAEVHAPVLLLKSLLAPRDEPEAQGSGLRPTLLKHRTFNQVGG